MHTPQDCSHRSRSSIFTSPNVSIGSSITLEQLAQFCADPKRANIGNVDVRAVLAFLPADGFFLWAQDGQFMHPVVDGSGHRIRYRTIETALEDLRGVSGLSAEVAVVQFVEERDPCQAQHLAH